MIKKIYDFLIQDVLTKKKIPVFSLLFILLFSSGVHASYDDALKLFKEKKFRESLKMLAEELSVANDLIPGSKNYSLRYLAAHNHWKLGNRDDAISHLRRCMDIKSDTGDPYVDVALIFMDLKKNNEAERIALKGLKVQKLPMLYYVLGKVSLTRKDYRRARTFFEKVNSLDPEIFISYHDLGLTLLKLGKISSANTAFSVAQAIRPKSPEILNNLGLSYELMKKYRKAKEYYLKAGAQDKNNPVIKSNIIRMKKRQIK